MCAPVKNWWRDAKDTRGIVGSGVGEGGERRDGLRRWEGCCGVLRHRKRGRRRVCEVCAEVAPGCKQTDGIAKRKKMQKRPLTLSGSQAAEHRRGGGSEVVLPRGDTYLPTVRMYVYRAQLIIQQSNLRATVSV